MQNFFSRRGKNRILKTQCNRNVQSGSISCQCTFKITQFGSSLLAKWKSLFRFSPMSLLSRRVVMHRAKGKRKSSASQVTTLANLWKVFPPEKSCQSLCFPLWILAFPVQNQWIYCFSRSKPVDLFLFLFETSGFLSFSIKNQWISHLSQLKGEHNRKGLDRRK